jgi:putative hemolysin
MSTIVTELLILLVLLLANGVFAMAEIALVSSRKGRLQALADGGSSGAKAALGLMEQPGVFLSTVQVGITLVGTLAGASSGAYLISLLTPVIAGVPYIGHAAEPLSTLLVVSVITYLSVVIGELVPKRLAIASPEGCASRLSPPMIALSRLASPLVRLLDASSNLIARLIGVRDQGGQSVSEDDVRAMLHQGTLSGVFKKSEQSMVEGVLDLDDLTAADLMTPKNHIVWLDLDESNQANWRKVAESGHSYFPAYRGVRDNVLGMVSVKSLWANLALEKAASMQSLLTPTVFVPETTTCAKVIEEFRKQGRHIAIVVDEYGGVAGLITLNDMMSAILGTLPEKEQGPLPSVRQQADGSWLADAMMDIEDLVTAIGLPIPEADIEEIDYRTLGGLILNHLGHVPTEGESFEFAGHQFQVIDMDRHRIDKVVIRPLPAALTAP